MKTTPEFRDAPLNLPTQRAPQKPAPAPVERRVAEHVVDVGGKLQTKDYPKPGWHCRFTEQQLAVIDGWEC